MGGLWFRAVVMWLLTALSGTAVYFGGGRAAWFIFGCLFILTLLGTIGSLLMKGEIAIARETQSQALHSGDSLLIRATAALPFRFPLAFVIIHEHWMNEQSKRLYRGSVMLVPLGRKQLQYTYEIPNVTRGRYRLHRVETIAVDFLHLSGFRCVRTRQHSPEIIVYPYMPQVIESDLIHARQEEDPVLLGGLRAYVPGDALRHIDWKSYLKRGKLMTKLPDPDAEDRPITLILDPGADEAQFERAVSAAAGLAAQLLQSVGAECEIRMVSGDRQSALTQGGGGLEMLLRELAQLERRADVPITALLSEAACRAAGDDCERILVTGRLDGRLARWVQEAKGISELSILFAADSPVLSTSEHRIQAELQRAGCMVGFMPSLPADMVQQQGGWPAYG